MRGARARGAAPSRADPRVHPDLRHGRIRRRCDRREMAAHAGAEFFPIPIRQCDLADHFCRRHLALRDAVRQRARRREVPAEPRGARRGLQGGADRRGIRRDSRRLSALPPRHAALQHAGPGPARSSQRCSPSWTRRTRSRGACCCRTAKALPLESVQRAARVRPVVDRDVFGAAGARCARSAQPASPRTSDSARATSRRCSSDARRSAPADGARRRCISRCTLWARRCCPATS